MRTGRKRVGLMGMLALCLMLLSGCLVQPDPSLTPITVSDPGLPFGQVTALPTLAPEATDTPAPTAEPEDWQANDSENWENWSEGVLPTTTPRAAATAQPGAEGYQTSATDYNAGYPVLILGSTGQDVSDLQTQLSLLRYYDGAIDGKYTAQVREAVAAFQEKNGLTADGVAGRETQDLLYSSRAKANLISAEAQEESYLLLKQGSAGIEVRRLQARLLELGYYSGGVDGLYGATTVEAVKAFQRNNSLSADGQAGAQTQSRLYSASARYAATPAATGDPDENRRLSLGMTGNDVYALQQRLISLRYLDGVADGVFGMETQEALTAFQRANNLTADGETGAATWKKLNGSARAASATPTPVPAATATLREGDSGENVYLLQARLFELGYYTGRVDGRYGSETTQAVQAFQRANGLAADGVFGRGTRTKLYSDSAVSAGAAPLAEDEAPSYDPASMSAMRRGERSENVRLMQERLVHYGYLSEADGLFGSATERAVKLFQEANGLTADGVAGQKTIQLLFGNDAVAYKDRFGKSAATAAPKAEKTAAPTATPRPNTNVILQWQSEGADVREYQARLSQLGYLSARYVNGTFNQPTVEATRAFQRMNGLKVDGAAGPETLALCYSKNAKNANGDVPGD